MIEITDRDGNVLLTIDATNLRGANLREANLREANLRGADLGGADLGGANLRGANLREAYLRGADLGGADLGGANLREANLRVAYLGGANLDNIQVSWCDHYLISEILFRAAKTDLSKQAFAGFLRIRLDWCWKNFLAMENSLKDWALDELHKWVKPGDDAPKEVRER